MRIQVLELPLDRSPETTDTPFALVIDRCPLSEVEYQTTGLNDFARAVGARGLLVTADEVEL
ncbi:hypothetical protein GCM10029976_090450 [Kribbella albertanoniae]|uniref:Uncharacterized protein n=1 Tax=Kribbella albertanoniae TaxID=1266829 RepID=A0A4R4PKA6_9ACTN|nr:hypothetical protein [Kribbella albertanoniae]TDC22492.1 hypothetical protein E1261_30750 [Kribbella albertanoniae]